MRLIFTVASFLCVPSVVSLLFTASAAEPPAQKPAPDLAQKIGALIQQLGDNNPRVREAATAELIAIGPDALELVNNARQSTSDFEVRARAERILQHISPDAIQARLHRTVIAELHDKDNNLKSVLDLLAEESKRACPERIGFTFVIRGEPQLTAPARQFRLRQRPLADALKMLADRYNMAFTLERNVIVFHPKTEGVKQ